jgi:hypothetical protein
MTRTNLERVERFRDLVMGDPEIGPLAAPMVAGAVMSPDLSATVFDRLTHYWLQASITAEGGTAK